jgi:MOSC domain-containing protein YiiM
MAFVLSVNTGGPVEGAWAGRLRRTGIDKRPVEGPVHAGRLGMGGDTVVDTAFHGGQYKAVYAFAREVLDGWEQRLGVRLPAGTFGENLTTMGIDLEEAVLGERWRVGSAVLSPAHVRIPCRVFAGWLGRHGADTTGWLRRFTADGRPGAYLRVLEEGLVRSGDPIVVEARPDHGVTVGTMFRALTTDRSLLTELLRVEDLPPEVAERARRHADGGSHVTTGDRG